MYPSNSKWSFFLGKEKKYSVWQAEKTLRIHDYLASVKPSETKWNRVTQKWNRVTPSETEWHQVTPSDTKWNQVKPSDVTPSPSDTKWHQVKPSDTKWTEVTPMSKRFKVDFTGQWNDVKVDFEGQDGLSQTIKFLTKKRYVTLAHHLSVRSRSHTTWQNKEQKRSRPCPNISIGRLLSCAPPQ